MEIPQPTHSAILIGSALWPDRFADRRRFLDLSLLNRPYHSRVGAGSVLELASHIRAGHALATRAHPGITQNGTLRALWATAPRASDDR